MAEKNVLLVEDNPDTRLIYATMLRREGYRVIEARDGREGVVLALESAPDVIVMNLVMPHVDGITATELIRAEPTLAHVPIIVCTALVPDDAAAMATDAGCDRYLEKPCEPSKLVDVVRSYIGPVAAGGM